MNFEFKCPQCGLAVETDEAYRGQVVECPHCSKGIVVPRGAPEISARWTVPGTPRGNGVRTAFPQEYQTPPARPGHGLQAVCPQCGQPCMGMPYASGNGKKTVSGWRYFVAWLAYSAASLLATALACFVVGAIVGAVLGANGVSMSRIEEICGNIGAVFFPLASIPIGYFSFRYIAITIINHGK